MSLFLPRQPLQRLKIHFVGAAGTGMVGLAEWAVRSGHRVSGSDTAPSPRLRRLQALGVKILAEQNGEGLADCDVVIVSSAVPKDNPEVVSAQKFGKKVLSRGKFLAELSRTFLSVGVCGSHGKSTTAALVGAGLREALNPTVYLGAEALHYGSSFHSGDLSGGHNILIAELDESDGSFLHFSPSIAVLTGLSADHAQHYGSEEKLEEAFAAHLSSASQLHPIVVCHEDEQVRQLVQRSGFDTLRYGFSEEADFQATSIKSRANTTEFTLKCREYPDTEVRIPLLGSHNVLNSLAAFAVGKRLGVSPREVARSLLTFQGLKQRMELLFQVRNFSVYLDYAHNPQKIRALLNGLRHCSSAKLICVFEPHRFSRLESMWSEFLECFSSADGVVVLPVFAAGELPQKQRGSEEFCAELKKRKKTSFCLDANNLVNVCLGISDTLQMAGKDFSPQGEHIIVFAGAGRVREFASIFLRQLGVLKRGLGEEESSKP